MGIWKRKKTNSQIRAMFALAKPRAAMCDQDVHEYLGNRAYEETSGRTSSLAELTFVEANQIISRLGGTKFAGQGLSKRTKNYHNQQAGIRTIATAAHLQKMEDLWFAFPHRTPNGLTQICLNTIKQERPRTADECNKIVEAVKSMNKRENASASTPPQPKFRRVA